MASSKIVEALSADETTVNKYIKVHPIRNEMVILIMVSPKNKKERTKPLFNYNMK